MSTSRPGNRPSDRPSVAGKRTVHGSSSTTKYSRDSYVGRRSSSSGTRRSTEGGSSARGDMAGGAPARERRDSRSAAAGYEPGPRSTGRHDEVTNPYDTGRYSSDRYAGRSSSGRPSARSGRARTQRTGAAYEPFFDRSADGIGKSIRRRRALLRGVIALAAVAIVVGGVTFFMSNAPITVSVNGTTMELSGDKTIQTAFKEAGEPAKAGNLVDVEGATLEEGKGYRFSFTVNGQPGTDPSSKLKEGDAVVFSDGGNIEEESDAVEEPIPHETVDQGYGPIHVVDNPGADGVKTTKTGKISGKTVTQTTTEPQDRVYHRYYPDTGEDKVVALTFDDGPWDTSTAEILDILKANDAKATFFTIGDQITGKGAELVKREADEGYQVCTHTWDHAAGSGQGVNLSFMSKDEQREEITKGIQAISDATGKEASKVIRAPGGNFPTEVWVNVEDLVTAEIGWDIDTEDWRKPGSDAIAQAIKNATPGDVILMHDGGGDRSQTVKALKEALPYLREQGYSFITIDELMKYPKKDI